MCRAHLGAALGVAALDLLLEPVRLVGEDVGLTLVQHLVLQHSMYYLSLYVSLGRMYRAHLGAALDILLEPVGLVGEDV
jgi:hypothetical protein